MPIYEYRCEEDGEVIALMRPMAEADEPVEDPEGKGRSFTRMFSSFAVGAEKTGGGDMPAPSRGGCGNCGPGGMCGL